MSDSVNQLPTILVVDDSPHDYDTYVRYINKARPNQYKTKLFSAGRHVFASLNEKPHCLLLDLSLPDMSGLDILEKLKEQNGGSLPFPVVMVTGSGDQSTGQKAVYLGAQDYLIKEEVTEESLPRSIEFAAARFQLEQKLRASEDRYRRLSTHMKLAADAAALGFWSFDLSTGAIDADENNRRALGLPLHESLKYEDFLNVVYALDRPNLENAVNKCIQTGVSYDEEFRVKGSDGSIHWIATRGAVVRNSEGGIAGMAGIAIDITERKRTQQELADSNDRLNLALNAAGMSTWEWDIPSDKIEWSANLEPQMAMPRGSFEGHYAAFLKLVYPEDRDRVTASISRTIETGVDYHIEFRMSKQDGGVRWTETRGRAIFDDEGKPIRMIGVDLDITERKQVEENYRNLAESLDIQVRARTKELEERNAQVIRQAEELRDLSAHLLHSQDVERRRIARELHDSAGQILAALGMTLASMVQGAQQDPARFSEDADEAQKLVQQLSQEIRTMSYLLHPPLLDESGLTVAFQFYVEGIAQRSGLKIQLEISKELGRLPRNTELIIFRLVQESLTNILRHSGSTTATIRIARKPDQLLLEVEDRGKGMSPEKLAQVQAQGSGVGLRGMRERLRLIGGHMNIESNEKGTKVSFTVPLQTSDSGSGEDRVPPLRAAG